MIIRYSVGEGRVNPYLLRILVSRNDRDQLINNSRIIKAPSNLGQSKGVQGVASLRCEVANKFTCSESFEGNVYYLARA